MKAVIYASLLAGGAQHKRTALVLLEIHQTNGS